MAGSRKSIQKLLDRHKLQISKELEPGHSGMLAHLARKGVFNADEEKMIGSEPDLASRADLFVEILSKKGFNAFREMCIGLELECPHLLTSLLLDSTARLVLFGGGRDYFAENVNTGSFGGRVSCPRRPRPHSVAISAHHHSTMRSRNYAVTADGLAIAHSRESSVVSGIFSMSPKCNNRDLELKQQHHLLANGSSHVETVQDARMREKLAALEDLNELLEEPVEEQGGERIAWEYHHVVLERVPGYGFGIAVSGGRDNPHFTNGDPSIAISDVLKAGPAEGKLLINDRVISANNVSLEGVDYATAVQVLRDSGQTVNLVVKRRVILPPTIPATSLITPDQPKLLNVSLSRSKKKEDFGLVLGLKIYVKEILARSPADKDGVLKEGDEVTKINGNPLVDNLSLKDVKKILDASKDKLDLVVRRSPAKNPLLDGTDKNNLVKNGGIPPRPPLPSADENSTKTAEQQLSNGEGCTIDIHEAIDEAIKVETEKLYEEACSSLSTSGEYGTIGGPTRTIQKPPEAQFAPSSEERAISFRKNGSVGIRLTGGNEVGIFVSAVQPGSSAADQGLQPGDKILKVNDLDMQGVTREEAVLLLLSLQDKVNLHVKFSKEEYEDIMMHQKGDSFFIRTHFNYDQPERGEMDFEKSEVFHVVDTLHNGVVGSWQALRVSGDKTKVHRGVIPNKARAEELATKQFNAAKKEQNAADQKGSSIFRRRRDKATRQRRSKSLGKDHWEDLVWSESTSKFPAYERVSLRHPGFPRPVVIFGPVSDMARDRLLKDFPGKFAFPQNVEEGGKNKSSIVRLSSIKEIMNQGKHALLDVTPNAVDKLNYAQLYPIVILAKAETKQTIKDCRAGLPKKSHMSSRKLFEQCQKLDKNWAHIFTDQIRLDDATSEAVWYSRLTEVVEKQQTSPLWMSEAKPDESMADDFLFPMTSRMSYTSSPDSDGEFCEPETPSISRQPSMIMHDPSAKMERYNSDPNLVGGNLGGPRSLNSSGIIPDYHMPPPNSAINLTLSTKVVKKERGATSNGNRLSRHDSQYTAQFAPMTNGNHGPHEEDTVDNLPLPPTPTVPLEHQVYRYESVAPPDHRTAARTSSASLSSSSSTTRRSQPVSQINGDSNHGSPKNIGSPDDNPTPPSIDRFSKPSRLPRDGYHTYNANRRPSATDSIDRRAQTRDQKMSLYDGYANGSAIPNNGLYTTTRYHRSKSQDAKSLSYIQEPHYGSKPVPPPKPKQYPTTAAYGHSKSYFASTSFNEGNYMNSTAAPAKNDDDSGQGSSLDREYNGIYNNEPRYANPPGNHYNNYYSMDHGTMNGNRSMHHTNPDAGLDLANNREYRGSAFEVYKKPHLNKSDPSAVARNLPSHHHQFPNSNSVW